MKQLNKRDAVQAMNSCGSRRIPFLFLVDFLAQASLVLPLDEIDPDVLLYDMLGRSNSPDVPAGTGRIHLEKYPVPFEQYRTAFEHVMNNIYDGNSYLLNLTVPTRIEIGNDLREIFSRSTAKYKVWMKDRFVVFSPEPFVRIRDGIISSYPMKGTIDASIVNAEKKILDNEKERAEHTTIVDLIRNDLSMVASDVRVESFRYIERIAAHEKDLLQVSSKITGRVSQDYTAQIGTLMFTLLPAGSISGAPKKKTLEIIRETEWYDRGYYTGVCGIFDGETLESGVMIRFIENIDGTLYYKSGGGITSLSTAELEYQEMIDKIYVPVH